MMPVLDGTVDRRCAREVRKDAPRNIDGHQSRHLREIVVAHKGYSAHSACAEPLDDALRAESLGGGGDVDRRQAGAGDEELPVWEDGG